MSLGVKGLIKLEFSISISEKKTLNADGRTDRHDEDNSRFPQFLRTHLKLVGKLVGLYASAK